MKVFISYRREDSAGYTGRLYDTLRSRFGQNNVFLDVSGIDSGRRFADVIQGAIRDCDVLLAVIGPEWLTCALDGRRRLDDPQDLVRTEILTAFATKVPVIPVLVGGAAPPRTHTLPMPLQPLADLDAHDMTDERWTYDADRLAEAIGTLVGDRPTRRPTARLTAGSVVIVLLLIGALFAWRREPASPEVAAGNAEGTTAAASGVAGEWEADVTYDWGATYTERLQLTVNGRAVSGTATFLGVPRGIVNGTLQDDRIAFETHTEEVLGDFSQPRQVVHRYEGRVVGDTIAFSMQSEGGASTVPVAFTARR